MGKNQTHKNLQRAKAARGSASGGGEDEVQDGMTDGTFHSPEWHAARLKLLQTTHTVTWEEWKAQRKEEARKEEEMHGIEEQRMKEYRALLDAERSAKLSRGRNHADKRDKKDKKKRDKGKDKDKKKKKKKKRKDSSESGSDETSEDDTEDEDDEDSDKKKKRKKKKSKDKGKRKRRRSDDTSSSDSEDDKRKGPVRLSSLFNKGSDVSEEEESGKEDADPSDGERERRDGGRDSKGRGSERRKGDEAKHEEKHHGDEQKRFLEEQQQVQLRQQVLMHLQRQEQLQQQQQLQQLLVQQRVQPVSGDGILKSPPGLVALPPVSLQQQFLKAPPSLVQIPLVNPQQQLIAQLHHEQHQHLQKLLLQNANKPNLKPLLPLMGLGTR